MWSEQVRKILSRAHSTLRAEDYKTSRLQDYKSSRLSKAETYDTDIRRLTTGILSEKCVVRRFCRCTNVIVCTYTNLDRVAYRTPSLYVAFCS